MYVDACTDRERVHGAGPGFLKFVLYRETWRNIYEVTGTGNRMPHMLVHHKVRDFAKWKPFFERHESVRKTGGSKNGTVFQNAEDPTDVFVLFEWDSVENARKFAMSEDLKKTMEQAGVMGVPHIHMLKEVQRYQA